MEKVIVVSFVNAETPGTRIDEVISPSEPGIYMVDVSRVYSHSSNGQVMFAALHYGGGQNLTDRSDPFRLDANNTVHGDFDLEHPHPDTAASELGGPMNVYYVKNTTGLYLLHQRINDPPTLLTETLTYKFTITKIG